MMPLCTLFQYTHSMCTLSVKVRVVHFCVHVSQFFQGKHLGGWVVRHNSARKNYKQGKNPSTKKSIYYCKKMRLQIKQKKSKIVVPNDCKRQSMCF